MKTVLASRSGCIQASLRATLGSFSQITVSNSASGGLSALNRVREDRPSLLVIDASLSEVEVEHLLKEAKRANSRLRYIVLVDTAREGQRLLSAGADMALMRDTLSGHLLEAMREMGLVDTPQDASHDFAPREKQPGDSWDGLVKTYVQSQRRVIPVYLAPYIDGKIGSLSTSEVFINRP